MGREPPGGKDRIVVVCPGRGTYNRDELGYLVRHHATRRDLVAQFDDQRRALGQPTVSELDEAANWSAAIHQRGDNASALIFACSLADFMAIDRDRFEIVAVTGNSMGWYTALACGGALTAADGFALANAMGLRMQQDGIGGQVFHTALDEDWQPIAGRREELLAMADAIPDLYVSIELGGMIVFAGSDAALSRFAEVAPNGRTGFSLTLPGHAAFHSPLLRHVSDAALAATDPGIFTGPAVSMIDGRGYIWNPAMSAAPALHGYTLGDQVVRTYHFTRAIAVALREFAPDRLVVLGPGETLGGAVIQSLLAARWRGWRTKAGYLAAQGERPFVLSMGREDQRGSVVGDQNSRIKSA